MLCSVYTSGCVKSLICRLVTKTAKFAFVLFAHNYFILESVELRVQVLQAALTEHDIDADSAIGVSIITDDRSSCMFSDNEEVSVYVYCSTII